MSEIHSMTTIRLQESQSKNLYEIAKNEYIAPVRKQLIDAFNALIDNNTKIFSLDLPRGHEAYENEEKKPIVRDNDGNRKPHHMHKIRIFKQTDNLVIKLHDDESYLYVLNRELLALESQKTSKPINLETAYTLSQKQIMQNYGLMEILCC